MQHSDSQFLKITLACYSPWGLKESNTTEQQHTSFIVTVKYQLYSLCCTVCPCSLLILFIVAYDSHSPSPILLIFPSLLPTGNDWFVLNICESVSYFYSLACFISYSPCVTDNIPCDNRQHWSFSVWLILLSIICS